MKYPVSQKDCLTAMSHQTSSHIFDLDFNIQQLSVSSAHQKQSDTSYSSLTLYTKSYEMKLSHRSCILFLFALSACCLHDGAAAEAFSAAQPKASRTRVSAAQTRDLHRLASATELTALPNDGDFPSSNRGSRRRRSFFSKILPLRAGGEGESSPSSSLSREMLAELLGTFLIVQIGTGSVMAAVFDNALVGLFQIAAVWSIAVTLAISATASVSGAHLNPAITIALAMLRPGGWAKVIPYCLSQLVGAILGSWVNLILYASKIREFEATNAIVRGTAGSVASAKAFGEYFV